MDMVRKLGEPVVHKHQWNNDDVTTGLAKQCPACADFDAYGQVRGNCLVCFRVGFVSVEDDLGNWINTQGQIVPFDPGTGVHAPLFGGYGQSSLTWIMEPDIAVDVFRINEMGVLVKTFNARGFASWNPKMGDNDLIANVDIGSDGFAIKQSNERFQLRKTQQITIRGWGSKTIGSNFQVNQSFEMSHVPSNDILYSVPLEN